MQFYVLDRLDEFARMLKHQRPVSRYVYSDSEVNENWDDIHNDLDHWRIHNVNKLLAQGRFVDAGLCSQEIFDYNSRLEVIAKIAVAEMNKIPEFKARVKDYLNHKQQRSPTLEIVLIDDLKTPPTTPHCRPSESERQKFAIRQDRYFWSTVYSRVEKSRNPFIDKKKNQESKQDEQGIRQKADSKLRALEEQNYNYNVMQAVLPVLPNEFKAGKVGKDDLLNAEKRLRKNPPGKSIKAIFWEFRGAIIPNSEDIESSMRMTPHSG